MQQYKKVKRWRVKKNLMMSSQKNKLELTKKNKKKRRTLRKMKRMRWTNQKIIKKRHLQWCVLNIKGSISSWLMKNLIHKKMII